jgi:hypothetical protein
MLYGGVTMIEDLTHLAISGVPIRRMLHEFINIHQGLSSLQTLALELIGFYPLPMPINPPRVSSIKLREFAQDCSVLRQHIRAPCIKALALMYDFERDLNLPDLLTAVSASLAQNATEINAQLQKPHRFFISFQQTKVFTY